MIASNQNNDPSPHDISRELSLQITQDREGEWLVKARFRKSNILSMEHTVSKLREIKKLIAEKYNEQFEALEFCDIAENSDNKLFILTTFRIKRAKLDQGEPVLKYRAEVAPDGYQFPDMIATIDIFPLDQFDNPVNKDRVSNVIRLSKIAAKCVDEAAVTAAYNEMIASKKPVKNYIIARGKQPDPCKDAEIEFYLAAVPEASNIDVYISSRRVEEGDPLCRKIPPVSGKEPGYNVFGEEEKSSNGLDIELIAGPGAVLTPYGQSVNAGRAGVARIERKTRRMMTPLGEKLVPVSIMVSVDPIRVIESTEKIEIATDEAVEIRGNLKFGSEIISSSEVFIAGNIEGSARIVSTDNVIVTGHVNNSEIASDNNVIVRGDILGSKVSAQNRFVAEGAINGTEVSAEHIEADSFVSSKLIANQSVTLNKIGSDEENIVSTIVLGMREFYTQRLNDNSEFISKAEVNLNKMRAFFGDETFDDLKTKTVQVAFVRYLSRLRKEGRALTNPIEISLHRRLMEAIPPTQSIITTRKQENLSLSRRLKDATDQGGAMLTVRERIASDTIVRIDNVEHKLQAPIEGPIHLKANEGKVVFSTGDNPTERPLD